MRSKVESGLFERWLIFVTLIPPSIPHFVRVINTFGWTVLEADRFHDESEINLDSNIHVCHDSSTLITPSTPIFPHSSPKDRTAHV